MLYLVLRQSIYYFRQIGFMAGTGYSQYVKMKTSNPIPIYVSRVFHFWI